MVTDGCVYEYKSGRYYLRLALSDYDHMEKIRDLVAPELKLVKTKNRNLWAFKAYSKSYIDWLIKNECVPRKTLTLKFPDKIPKKYMRDFMRGVMDGDGSIGFRERGKNTKSSKCYYCSSSLWFITGINKYLDSLNIKYSLTIQKAGRISKPVANGNGKVIQQKHDHYRTTLNHADAYKLLKIIYYHKNRLSLERKQITANKIIHYYENRNKTNHFYSALLTKKEAIKIRKMWATGKFKKKANLIKYFKTKMSVQVDNSVFYKILSNKTYKI